MAPLIYLTFFSLLSSSSLSTVFHQQPAPPTPHLPRPITFPLSAPFPPLTLPSPSLSCPPSPHHSLTILLSDLSLLFIPSYRTACPLHLPASSHTPSTVHSPQYPWLIACLPSSPSSSSYVTQSTRLNSLGWNSKAQQEQE